MKKEFLGEKWRAIYSIFFILRNGSHVGIVKQSCELWTLCFCSVLCTPVKNGFITDVRISLLSRSVKLRFSRSLCFSTDAEEKASEASLIMKYVGVKAGRWAKRAKRRTPSSFPFDAGIQFSGDSTCAFNDRMKIRENRAPWTVYC